MLNWIKVLLRSSVINSFKLFCKYIINSYHTIMNNKTIFYTYFMILYKILFIIIMLYLNWILVKNDYFKKK